MWNNLLTNRRNLVSKIVGEIHVYSIPWMSEVFSDTIQLTCGFVNFKKITLSYKFNEQSPRSKKRRKNKTTSIETFLQ